MLKSWWDEWMEDVVWRLALFVSTISGGTCDMFSAVKDSRILLRDSRLLLSLVIFSRRSTVLVRSAIVVFYRVTVSSRSTRSLFMRVRSIPCVVSFFSTFAMARAWPALLAVGIGVGTDCDALLSLIIYYSALLTTMPTSNMDSAIRSSVRCSNVETVVCVVVCVLRSWISMNCTVAFSLLMVSFVLVWKSSVVMSVFTIFWRWRLFRTVFVTLSGRKTVRHCVLRSKLAVLVLRLFLKSMSLLSRCGPIRLTFVNVVVSSGDVIVQRTVEFDEI